MQLLGPRSDSRISSAAAHTSGRATTATPPLCRAAMSSRQQQQQQLVLQLYDDPHSEFCAKVKVALHCKGLSWQVLPVSPCGGSSAAGGSDASASADSFRERVPLGKIPALVVRGLAGTAAEVVLAESEVINEWLQEQFPEPSMMPQDPLARSKARLLSRFHDLHLEPALRALYPQVVPGTRDAAVVTAAAAQFTARLAQLEQLLPGGTRYAAAEHLTLADCGYPALLLYAEKMWPALGLGPLKYERLPKLRALRQVLLCEDASVAAVLAELEPAAQAWLDGKLGLLEGLQPQQAVFGACA